MAEDLDIILLKPTLSFLHTLKPNTPQIDTRELWNPFGLVVNLKDPGKGDKLTGPLL